MAVIPLDPPKPKVTAQTDLERFRDHSICGSYPLNDSGPDGVHTLLGEAYAVLSVIEAGCEEGGAFDGANSIIRSRALCAIQRLIAQADFEAISYRTTKGSDHV